MEECAKILGATAERAAARAEHARKNAPRLSVTATVSDSKRKPSVSHTFASSEDGKPAESALALRFGGNLHFIN